MDDTLTMSVSPVCEKDGKKFAYVQFTDGRRTAEGRIPNCEIMNNQGFTEEEVTQLSEYMREHLQELKSMAARLNAFDVIRNS